MPYVSIEDLLSAGAHFGHLTRRWNPQMRNYIFMERNGIHIIDLKKTQTLVDEARNAAERIAAEGKRILFVGTKKQARDVIRTEAQRCGTNFVTERWLGGMLTNFATIRKSIKRLKDIDRMESDGTVENLTKKERLMLSREKEKLVRIMGGIVDMNRLPGALYIVDIRKEHLAIKEAKTLGIPVIAIVDTNTDPRDVAFPIPANDDSLKTIALITKVIADGVSMGREASRAAGLEDAASGDRALKESGMEDGDESKVRTRNRTRTRRGKDGAKVEGAAAEGTAAEGTDMETPEAAPQTEGTSSNQEASQGA